MLYNVEEVLKTVKAEYWKGYRDGLKFALNITEA